MRGDRQGQDSVRLVAVFHQDQSHADVKLASIVHDLLLRGVMPSSASAHQVPHPAQVAAVPAAHGELLRRERGVAPERGRGRGVALGVAASQGSHVVPPQLLLHRLVQGVFPLAAVLQIAIPAVALKVPCQPQLEPPVELLVEGDVLHADLHEAQASVLPIAHVQLPRVHLQHIYCVFLLVTVHVVHGKADHRRSRNDVHAAVVVPHRAPRGPDVRGLVDRGVVQEDPDEGMRVPEEASALRRHKASGLDERDL
mmetsp:Transcript_97495/g.275852  ORF Transcript_97495/g.275852 Transcript_97495/m.275852 type:complete len:254 (-) Transcript_97495:130-891(-)